jgi:hypothetical protein
VLKKPFGHTRYHHRDFAGEETITDLSSEAKRTPAQPLDILRHICLLNETTVRTKSCKTGATNARHTIDFRKRIHQEWVLSTDSPRVQYFSEREILGGEAHQTVHSRSQHSMTWGKTELRDPPAKNSRKKHTSQFGTVKFWKLSR